MCIPLVWQALAINPANPQQLYAMADIRGAIHTSTDGGANWKQLGTTELFGGFSRRLYTTATDERFLLNLAQPGGLARSRDGGRTWTMLREGLPGDEREVYVLSVAIDPQDANVIYAGTGGFVGQGHGVYKSTDGGDTWSPSNRGMIDYRITAVAVDPRNSNIVYAGSDAGELFKSEDGGQQWTELTEQLGLDPNMHSTLQQIIFDSAQPGRLYLLAAYTGIFIGTTDGTRWQVLKVPSDSGSTSIKTMTIVPGATLHVLVGLEREGGLQYLAQ